MLSARPSRRRRRARAAPPRAAAQPPLPRRYPRLSPGSSATSSPPGQSSPERCSGGPAQGEDQRRWLGVVEAGPRDRPGAARTGRVGGAGEGAQRWDSAARRRRNGRVAPYTAAKLTGRARGRAGRQSAGSFPAHATSPCSPQSARGEPRHVGCSAIATPTQRQGRAIRGRAAHRARTRARGAAQCRQFSCASNEPIFAAIGAR